MVAVADGIGGHRAGAYASREVLTSLAESSEHHPASVEQVLQETHRKFQEIGALRPELEGTGTAVAGIFAGKDGLFAFNVGDARLYRQHAGRLHLITKDDSVEQLLVQEGLMKAHDGVRSAFMHALTQSVGGSSEPLPMAPHFYPLKVAGNSRFLLCTDGLTDMISSMEMESYLLPKIKPVAAVQSLFSAAMQSGGRDNITIAIVDVETG
jgi:protein phosphatase